MSIENTTFFHFFYTDDYVTFNTVFSVSPIIMFVLQPNEARIKHRGQYLVC